MKRRRGACLREELIHIMRLDDLCAALECAVPPLDGCEDFDGAAFIPEPGREVRRIVLALEADTRTAAAAVNAGADLLLTHHPMLYGGEPEAGSPQYIARELLVSHGIAAISLHARLDAARGGMNDTLAGMLGVFDMPGLVPFGTPEAEGLGRIGTLRETSDGRSLALVVKEVLGAPRVVLTCPEKKIRRAAVVTGSCSDFVPRAAELGVDAIIGGEFKYHTLDYALSVGICCIGAGHYYTERHAPEVLGRLVGAILPAAEIIISDPGCPAEVL